MIFTLKRSFFVFAVFTCVMGLMACLKFWTLHTAYCDLGIFDRMFWGITHLGEWQWAFYGHVQPLMLPESLGYWLWPSPYYLLVLQTLCLSLPVLLIPAILRSVVWPQGFSSVEPVSIPLFVALAYVLYTPLWYIGLFDFHMDHLAIPLGFGFYWACFKRRWGIACAVAMVLALVKEPFALVTAFCGIYVAVRCGLWARKGRRLRADGRSATVRTGVGKFVPLLLGGWLFCFGVGYFYWATNVIGSYFASDIRSALHSSAFTWMGDGVGAILLFLVSHPVTVVKEILGTPGKLIYLVVVFGSLGFLPLLRPVELIPALPILGIALLSRLHLYYAFGHHYAVGLIAPFVVGFALGIPRAVRIWERAGFKRKSLWVCVSLCIILSHVLLSTSPLSRLFWTKKVWKYTYSAYLPTDRESMIKRVLEQKIPDDSEAAISVQNTLNLGRLAQRKYYLLFPNGVLEPQMHPDFSKRGELMPVSADYVVLDLKRPWFLGDQGCDWYYGECRDKEMAEKFMDFVEKTRSRYRVIFEQDGFMILKRACPVE